MIQQVDRFYHAFDQADLPLVRQLRDLAKAYQDKEISAESFARSVAAADLEGAGRAAREYAAALREIAERSNALTTGLLFDGVAVEIDAATASVEGLLEELHFVANLQGLGDVVVQEIRDVIAEMNKGKKSAQEAADEIELSETPAQTLMACTVISQMPSRPLVNCARRRSEPHRPSRPRWRCARVLVATTPRLIARMSIGGLHCRA